MKGVSIYFEGGGKGSSKSASTLKPLRSGMSTFLSSICNEVRQRRFKWNVIPCSGRAEAFAAFVDAVRHEPDFLNVLLVDSEDAVTQKSPWRHLKDRADDKWTAPASIDDSHCHLMAVCMEAWFVADHDGLARHFGSHFRTSALPAANLAETRTKSQLESALRNATRDTPAREYKKIRDGAKLLSEIDPIVVRQHCPWCDRLFTTLGEKLGVDL